MLLLLQRHYKDHKTLQCLHCNFLLLIQHLYYIDCIIPYKLYGIIFTFTRFVDTQITLKLGLKVEEFLQSTNAIIVACRVAVNK